MITFRDAKKNNSVLAYAPVFLRVNVWFVRGLFCLRWIIIFFFNKSILMP